MNRKLHLILAFMAATLFVGIMAVPSMAATVVEGPTPIFEGAATADNDLTMYNDKIALSFAVGTNNYWNMTRGSVLDIGINDGQNNFKQDLTNDSEFLLDLWTSTGSYKGENLLTDVDAKYSVDGDTAKVVMKTRYWVADADKNGKDDEKEYGTVQKPLNVTTTYTLKDGDSFVTMVTTVENPAGNKVTYKNMYSGYSISTNAASMYGPFGFYPEVKTTGIAVGANEKVQERFGEFVATYSDSYTASVQMDDADSYKGSSGYKDVYKLRNIAPGHTEKYTGELLVSDKSETASIISRYIARENIKDASKLSGTVTDDSGKPVAGAYVIVEKTGVYMPTEKSQSVNGQAVGTPVANMMPFVWTRTDENGKYSFDLPNTGWNDGTENVLGNSDYTYKLKVEASGYTSLLTDEIKLTGDKTEDLKIEQGAHIHLRAVDQKGNAIPFKIQISGITAEMKTLGGAVQFSDAFASSNDLDFNLSKAENVTITATYSTPFLSKSASWTGDITSAGLDHTFVIDIPIDAKAEGWYNMDNHNHSDYGDGSTTIKDLFSFQIAQGLDFNVVTDHDTRIHNAEMAQFAKDKNRVFLSNIEVSPGWGHWGYLGVDYSDSGAPIDPSTATPKQIADTGHKLGATVIMHHPFSDYGFLNNQTSVNGGTEEGWDSFDLLELQNTMDLTGLDKVNAADWAKINRQNLAATLPSDKLSGVNDKMDAKALLAAMSFWNEGIEKYLSAGSDAHDAHNTSLYSGVIREFAKLDTYSQDAYTTALKSGKAYVTCGPVLFPADNAMFGSKQSAKAGDELTFDLDVQAIDGFDTIYLYRNGVCIDKKELNGTTDRTAVSFKTIAPAGKNVWYSFTAVDKNNHWAATDPIWVDVKGFTDVTSADWFYDTVSAIVDKGLMNGTGDGSTFSPKAQLTRGMAATVLYRMSGETTGVAAEAAATFSDVDSSKWYAAAVDWAADNGIVKGSDGKFKPNDNITRQDMATMLYRYAQYKKADTSKVNDLSAFSDKAAVSSYASEGMQWAVGAGIVSGRDAATLAPKAKISRAEFATMVSRYLA